MLSIPVGVPTKRISVSGFRVLSSSAIAIAGDMWLPVPPAANITLRVSAVAAAVVEALVVLLVGWFTERQPMILKFLTKKRDSRFFFFF